MTKKEAVLVSAYTGYLLTKDYSEYQRFCEKLLGRKIFTHEFKSEDIQNELHEKCKPLIIEMVKNEERESINENEVEIKHCPFCGGEAEIQTGNFGMLTIQSYAAAVCTKCKARGPMFRCSIDYCAADEAKKAWNNYGCAQDEMTEESNACDKKSDGLNSDLIVCDEFSLSQDDEGNLSDGQD